MSLLINLSTIKKLNHNLRDIRQKALKEVTSKLKEGIETHEEVVCNSVDLYKSLVVALNDTKNDQSEVVDALLYLFKSHYALALVNIIGVPQIRRDTQNALRKVYQSSFNHRSSINDFYKYLSTFEADNLSNALHKTLTLKPPDLKLDFPVTDYVKCWSRPHVSDLEEMKTLKMSLLDRSNFANMDHALNFLHGSIKNLPAEFFLQPPYLYKSLFECLLLDSFEKPVLAVLYDLTKSLQARMKIRTLTRTCEVFVDVDDVEQCQLSVPAYCYHLIMTIMRALKEIVDHSSQERLTVYFELMRSVVDVLKGSQGQSENESILREMSFLAKFYREQYQNTKGNYERRVNYLTVLQMIAEVASCRSKDDGDVVRFGNDDMDELPIWRQELEISLMDFSVREAMPDVYCQVYKICNAEENVRLASIIHAAKILLPAVEVLRSPTKYNDEELLVRGLPMLETLKLHRSEGLVRKLMKAVLNCAPYFYGNTELRQHGELLFLHLIATNIPKLKLLAYQLTTDAVKSFFAQVSDGTASVLKMYDSDVLMGSRFMGIPINADILTEIICFGLKSDKKAIQEGSEMVVTYIVKGKPLFGKHWNKYFEILLPVLPLLQAVVPVSSLLGHGIATLMDPDFDFPQLECIHGNIRYLFTSESQAREDACLRLMYMTSKQPQAKNYLPNIDHIKDTLTNSLCIIRNRLPLRNPMKSGVFDVQSMRDLIEILKCEDSSPKVRYSTLIQLNAFVDDPTLCDVLHTQKGWPYVLQAFCNAMKVDHNRDFPDSAVPALQILCKLCLRSSVIRRNFAQDVDFNLLLMRAMFMHYHDNNFRFDAATLVFMMAFLDFVVGEDDLTVPKVLSDLFIPFQCEFHDKVSPYDVTSELEALFLGEEENEEAYDDILIVIDEKTSPKVGRKHRNSFKTDPPMYEHWQYLRMTFTTLWFDGLDFVLQNINQTQTSRKHGIVNYQSLPEHLLAKPENDETTDILDFDPRLELLETDINLIKITSLPEIIKHNIHRIENATNHREAAGGICSLKSIIFLPHYEEHYPKDLTKVIKRFIVTPPKTTDDEYLFKLVLDLLDRLIRIGYDTVLLWVLTQLNDHNSLFIRLLYDKRQTVSLFTQNIALIQTSIKAYCCTDSQEIRNSLQSDEKDLILRVFEIISEELDKCDKDRVQALLSLLKVITEYAKLETDETLLNKVITQLFYCLKVMKSLTHSGSFIAKNCLFSIGNIMKYIREPSLDPKLIRLLQALCGHTDFIVRSCAWSILSIVATSISGAKQIVKELAFLPGGIHACIIQSMLDPEEVSLVKGTAGTLFVNLLSYRSERGLNADVWPKCKETVDSNDKKDGFVLVAEILRKQRFLERVRDALDRFSPDIYVDPEAEMQMLTAPDTVIHLANILISVGELRPVRALTEGEKLTLELFLKCTYTIVPINIASTTLAMVTSICNLLSRYLMHDKSVLGIILHNSWFMVSILKLLDLQYYETEQVCEGTCSNILHLIQTVAMYPQGYEHICHSLEQINVNNFMHFFNINMIGYENSGILIDVMNCLTVLTMRATQPMINCQTFHTTLDSISVNDPLRQEEIPGLSPTSEVLTKRLIFIFEAVCEQDKPKSGVFYISDVKLSCYNCLQAVLRHTEHGGSVATHMGLFEKVVARFKTIVLDIGMSSRDFIHKYGDRKKKPILQELGLLAGLISNWYCREPMSDPEQVEQLLKCLRSVWEWTLLDLELLLKFLTVLMVLSEKSLIVCKALATFQSVNQPTFLKRIVDIAKNDTRKSKSALSIGRLKVAVRILVNCCSCVEGRVQLLKLNVLEIFDLLHPQNTKKNKSLRHATPIWLNFYEIFSRYPEGATAKHLSLLCALARKQFANVRITSIKILRNMAFFLPNRANLLTSPDFIYIVKEKLEFGDVEEQVAIVAALWKLVANSCRSKNEIKNSAIYVRLNDLSNRLAVKKDTDTLLFQVLGCLLDVLNSNN